MLPTPFPDTPLWDLSSFNDISSESLGLLTSSVVKLRSLSLLLDRTRSSTAALDSCLVPFRFDFASPFINLACVEACSWDCLTDELLLETPEFLMLDWNSDSRSENCRLTWFTRCLSCRISYESDCFSSTILLKLFHCERWFSESDDRTLSSLSCLRSTSLESLSDEWSSISSFPIFVLRCSISLCKDSVSSSITLLLKNDYESCVIHILLPSKWTLSLKNTVNIFLINLKLNNSFQWFTGWSLLTLILHWWQMDHCDGSFHLYSVLTWIGFGQIPAGYIHHA